MSPPGVDTRPAIESGSSSEREPNRRWPTPRWWWSSPWESFMGIPFAIPLAMWAGLADLIPAVGAYLGAAPRSWWRSYRFTPDGCPGHPVLHRVTSRSRTTYSFLV